MAAAEEVFGEQGLQAAHVGDIAVRAGVSVGTLYNHFEDRDALLSALLDARCEEMLSRVDEAAAQVAAEPFEAQLERFVRALFENFDAHRRFFSIFFEMDSAHGRAAFPAPLRKPRPRLAELHQRLDELMKRGVKQRALRSDDAELYSAMLMGMVKAIVIRDFDGKARFDVPGRARQVTRFFLQGAGH